MTDTPDYAEWAKIVQAAADYERAGPNAEALEAAAALCREAATTPTREELASAVVALLQAYTDPSIRWPDEAQFRIADCCRTAIDDEGRRVFTTDRAMSLAEWIVEHRIRANG